jgi:hypothetical protein
VVRAGASAGKLERLADEDIGFEGTVAVQARQTPEETRWLVELMLVFCRNQKRFAKDVAFNEKYNPATRFQG